MSEVCKYHLHMRCAANHSKGPQHCPKTLKVIPLFPLRLVEFYFSAPKTWTKRLSRLDTKLNAHVIYLFFTVSGEFPINNWIVICCFCDIFKSQCLKNMKIYFIHLELSTMDLLTTVSSGHWSRGGVMIQIGWNQNTTKLSGMHVDPVIKKTWDSAPIKTIGSVLTESHLNTWNRFFQKKISINDCFIH